VLDRTVKYRRIYAITGNISLLITVHVGKDQGDLTNTIHSGGVHIPGAGSPVPQNFFVGGVGT
jgi:hypothetical protein